jgi:hypothetical protein
MKEGCLSEISTRRKGYLRDIPEPEPLKDKYMQQCV